MTTAKTTHYAFAGPFAVKTPHAWLEANWVLMQRTDGAFRVRWTDPIWLEAGATQSTRLLRLAQAPGWAEQIPVLTGIEQQVLRSGLADKDPAPLLNSLLAQKPGLALPLIREVNTLRYGYAARPVRTLEEALLRMGIKGAVGVLQAVLLLDAVNDASRLQAAWERAAQMLRWVRMWSADQGADPERVSLAANFRVMGDALLAHFGSADKAGLLDRLIRHGAPRREAQIFLYGVSGQEMGASVARHWQMPRDTIECLADQDGDRFLDRVDHALPALAVLDQQAQAQPGRFSTWLRYGQKALLSGADAVLETLSPQQMQMVSGPLLQLRQTAPDKDPQA
ncbi:HDOD domain-containing protein [Thiomonas sp.]